MNGWTQLGTLMITAGVVALCAAAGLVWLLLAAVRHLLAQALDERDEVRAERRTSREVPPC